MSAISCRRTARRPRPRLEAGLDSDLRPVVPFALRLLCVLRRSRFRHGLRCLFASVSLRPPRPAASLSSCVSECRPRSDPSHWRTRCPGCVPARRGKRPCRVWRPQASVDSLSARTMLIACVLALACLPVLVLSALTDGASSMSRTHADAAQATELSQSAATTAPANSSPAAPASRPSSTAGRVDGCRATQLIRPERVPHHPGLHAVSLHPRQPVVQSRQGYSERLRPCRRARHFVRQLWGRRHHVRGPEPDEYAVSVAMSLTVLRDLPL